MLKKPKNSNNQIAGANAYADVVLALDNNDSIDAGELQEVKDTANAIVDAFKLDETNGRIRIGVSRDNSGSGSSASMDDVDDHLSPDTPLHDSIDDMILGGSSEFDFVEGLEDGADQFGTGLGDRPGIPNLIIFITEGNDTAGNSLTDIENASLATGAEVFAVGVGSVSTPTLEAIATDPNADHIFYTSDYAGLLALVDAIVSASLDAAKNVFEVEGGASDSSSVSGGTLYDVQSIAQDGSAIYSRVLYLPDNTVVVKSVQTD